MIVDIFNFVQYENKNIRDVVIRQSTYLTRSNINDINLQILIAYLLQ